MITFTNIYIYNLVIFMVECFTPVAELDFTCTVDVNIGNLKSPLFYMYVVSLDKELHCPLLSVQYNLLVFPIHTSHFKLEVTPQRTNFLS